MQVVHERGLKTDDSVWVDEDGTELWIVDTLDGRSIFESSVKECTVTFDAGGNPTFTVNGCGHGSGTINEVFFKKSSAVASRKKRIMEAARRLAGCE